VKRAAGALALVALALGSFGAEGDGARSPAPAPLTSADIGGRLRVFAKPGDFALKNDVVTAVVRKSDGFLTEFWRNQPTLPTSEQLGLTTNIDGIWQIVPVVRLGDVNHPLLASRVSALADGIEVEGVTQVKGVTMHATSVYRLHPSEPRLMTTTTLRFDGDHSPGPIELGDEVKWGNTTYFVEGVKTPGMKYKGHARWVGRKGAGGDLMLRPTSGERMWIDYATSAKTMGAWGAISAVYWRKELKPGKSVTVSRELVYATLPIDAPRVPTEVGTLKLTIRDENGKRLAAKIEVEQERSNRALFPADGDLNGADHFLWTGNGDAKRTLPRGRFRVLVTAGIERDASFQRVTIETGKTTSIDAALPRVISTPGMVAADLHLHQAPSVDADISLPARVVAVAAEGVELAVASDHYVVTDLAPTVRWLRERGVLANSLITVSGSEVSTLGTRFGHFNVFPLALDRNVKYVDTTPKELFADARKQSPDGVLQVNHPRMSPALGYFNFFQLDPATGEPHVAGYDPNFDSLEVYNGGEAFSIKKVKQVLRDYLHLLGRGRHYVATGSSDSHNLAFLDPGLPRTMIRYASGGSDEEDLATPAKTLIQALKAGHAIVTSGPFIEASIDGKGPGDTAHRVGKIAHLHVVVKAAPWIDVSAVEVLEGGSVNRAAWLAINKKKNQKQKVLRFDHTFDLRVKQPTFFVVTAIGEKPLSNVSRGGTLPFAFTNPIWVEP
jgi:hypothetical protein